MHSCPQSSKRRLLLIHTRRTYDAQDAENRMCAEMTHMRDATLKFQSHLINHPIHRQRQQTAGGKFAIKKSNFPSQPKAARPERAAEHDVAMRIAVLDERRRLLVVAAQRHRRLCEIIQDDASHTKLHCACLTTAFERCDGSLMLNPTY